MMDFLLNIPKEHLYVVIGVMLGAVCALHLLSGLLREFIAKILQYVNIALHIVLFCTLMLAEVKIEVTVLIYMASVFVSALVSYIKFVTVKRRGKERECK